MCSRSSPTADGRGVGILGGSFDPPHSGHLTMAREARSRLGLERVIFLPAPVPPHKSGIVAGFADRYEMVRRLVGDTPGMEVWDFEATLAPPHYTVETLRHLLEGPLQGRTIHLIVGADSLVDLHSWREPETLFTLARLVVVSRPGVDRTRVKLPAALVDQILFVDGVMVDASSRDLRRRLAAGERPPEVPEPVMAFIVEHGLYGRVS